MPYLEVKDANGVTRKLAGRYNGDEFIPNQETQLLGSTVAIGATEFERDGRVIHGLAIDRPDADDAHAVIKFAYYNSADTGVIAQTDGTNWVVQ